MALLALLIVFFVSPLLNGLVLSVLWDWFMVSTLHAPHLSIPAALGIALVVGHLTGPHEDKNLNKYIEKKQWGSVCVHILTVPLIVLCIGWVYHKFM